MKIFNCKCCKMKRRNRPSLLGINDDIYIEEGATAFVYQDMENPEICKKKYKVNVNEKLIKNEIVTLKNINSIHNVNSPKFIKYNKNKNILYMEYIEGIDLCNYLILNKTNNLPIKTIIKKLLIQINNLHQQNIIHLDLKMDNMIINLQTYEISILDWGNSVNLNEKRKIKRKILKTPYYQSPESFDNIHNKPCDIWSLGIILYIFIYKTFPFSSDVDENSEHFYQDIKHTICLNDPFYPEADKDVIDLIKKLLLKDPEKRITAEIGLKHKYFNNI